MNCIVPHSILVKQKYGRNCYDSSKAFDQSILCTKVSCQYRLYEVTMPCAKLLPVLESVLDNMLCDAPNPFVQVHQSFVLVILVCLVLGDLIHVLVIINLDDATYCHKH